MNNNKKKNNNKENKKSRKYMPEGEPLGFRLTRHDAYVETSYAIAAATCVPQSVRFSLLAMIWM